MLLSTQQWDSLNTQLEEMTALVDYLEVKLKLATGETSIDEVDLAELKAEVYGVTWQ